MKSHENKCELFLGLPPVRKEEQGAGGDSANGSTGSLRLRVGAFGGDSMNY
jgi:hypothetical protein